MPDEQAAACFIDTNVWLYAFVESGESAKSAVARGLIRATQPIVSTQVINEVCVNLLKRARFTEEQVGQLIESFYTECSVIELTQSVLMAASQLRQRYSLSFWDGLIIAAALTVGAETLYSEDLQHGLSINGRLQVINPFVES